MEADHSQLGARLVGAGSAEFVVWAPKAARVDVRLLGKPERLVALEPRAGGYFARAIDNVDPATRYFYRLDGKLQRPDPASRFQPEGVHGPSQIIDEAFDWQDADWRGLPLRNYVLYELHVGTFSAAGTFAGVIPHLDALAELGVTAIELMPVAQFPGSRNWGYDGVYPFAAQNSYGGPLELKRLVDACHARGLALVLDVVYNHLGPEGNYLADFAPYFNLQHQTPWGPALNFEGPDSDPVRRYFIDNARRWIEEFHVDALRLDAIHALIDRSARPFLAELADAVRDTTGRLSRPAHLIAENNRNDPRIFEPPVRGGYGLDAQWLDDFGRALQGRLTGERTGFYVDFGQVRDVAKAWRSGYVLDGDYSNYRRRRHGSDSSGVPRERFIAYVQTHDQVGNRPHSDRLSTQVGFDQLKLAAAAVLLSPYQPLLFMGEEYGETAPFHYFISHLDPDLVQRVRNGRRHEFAAFAWQSEPADPAAESTFAKSKLNHALRESGWHKALWNCYRELLKLRRGLPALRNPAPQNDCVESWEDPAVLIATRQNDDQQIAILLNFSDAEVTAPPTPLVAGQAWHKQFDSRDLRWQGSGSLAPDQWDPISRLTLGPWGAIVYQRNR